MRSCGNDLYVQPPSVHVAYATSVVSVFMENALHNLKNVQIPRLRGTYIDIFRLSVRRTHPLESKQLQFSLLQICRGMVNVCCVIGCYSRQERERVT